jgi:hypothetical protein
MQVDRVGRIVDGDDHDGRYRSERRETASSDASIEQRSSHDVMSGPKLRP